MSNSAVSGQMFLHQICNLPRRFFSFGYPKPDSKGVCHPLQTLVLKGTFWDLLPRVCFHLVDCSQQRGDDESMVTFSVPGSGLGHDQGLANFLPSATAISLSCAVSKTLLSQPNLVLNAGTSSWSPLLLTPP